MDFFERGGRAEAEYEDWLRERYEAILREGREGYCLVSLVLKNYMEYAHHLDRDERETAIRICSERLAACLDEEEYIVRLHSVHFNLLVKCDPTLDALHPKAAAFHYAIRDAMEARYGRKLFLEMGFYPILDKEVDFFNAQYFANRCRVGSEYRYPETNYDMYDVSYFDQQEEFFKFEKLVQPALEHGEFKLYLQPKVNVRTGEVECAEALMRWIDPIRGLIPLSSFLPNLEENGFIREVDIYLFDKGCAYMADWRHKYGKNISISFNISRAYFNGPFFMPDYTEVFQKYDISPEQVRIELLESIVLDDLERLLPLVKDIYDFGFSCALDDFGSGFSSFSVLTNVRLSELKIDRSLLRNVENPKERALLKHIVDVAHDMDMVAVAEGVEQKEYADYLKTIGCDFIQGFYYYRPMPAEEFEERFVRPKQ